MKAKIFKQFGAAIASVLIIYGIISTTYRSYQGVLAAQAEIPDIVLVSEEIEDVEAESTIPSTIVETTPAEEIESELDITVTAEATTEDTSSETDVNVAAATPVQEDEVITPETSSSDNQTIVTEPDPVVPTLNEYLSQLRCGGCGKNCSLINPRCGTGQRKASNAQEEYYSLYS
ncbi:hypothetical protein Q5O14_06580 [Eubacteriaceae bacterium ES2]|nr:hypothetical protein Q5O14_06580 [Eubacteriaceae bacterium ES2]